MNEELKHEMDTAHREFFERFHVDVATGNLRGPRVKFATYPHIGSQYGEIKKLMIVGLDIGQDPLKGGVLPYEGRRSQIEEKNPSQHNPHMSGTYVTAMRFFAGEFDEWDRWWADADKEREAQALLKDASQLPSHNPLSYIAFTNIYKFLLDINGSKVRLESKGEEQFLLKEARILDPQAIILQSATFRRRKSLLNKLAEVADVFVGNHPSVRGKERRIGKLIRSIQPWQGISTFAGGRRS